MTNPSRPNKQPRPVWVVTGNLDGYEDVLYRLGGKKYRGAWSFWSDPTTRLAEEIVPENQLSFEERQQAKLDRHAARADRLRTRSDKHRRKADSRFGTARDILAPIPPGQPVLVGHHSEHGHRAALNRHDTNMRKGFEHASLADHLSDRADYNEQMASGKRRPGYVGNRIRETKAEIRRLEKHEARGTLTDTGREILAEYRERLAYWETELVRTGGTRFSRETVKKGDWVKYRGTWYPVKRTNRDTVTISNWLGIERFTWLVPYDEIRDCMAQSDSAANASLPMTV